MAIQIWRHRRPDDKRLKVLEAENARLIKMYADVQLQNEVLKDIESKNVWSASFCKLYFVT